MLALTPKEAAILARIAESPFIDESRAVELLQGSDAVIVSAARAIVRARETQTVQADTADPVASDIAEAFLESARTNKRPTRRAV